MRNVLSALAAFLLLAGTLAAQDLAVPVTVEDWAGVARSAEPASGGIPLPWGVYKKDQAFALFDGEKEIPCQALPLVVDEKGFLRWILLDLQADLPAKGRKTFTLKAVKPQAAPAAPVKVTEDANGVVVDTGRLRFTVAKDKPFGLLAAAQVDGKDVVSGGEVAYVDDIDGKRYVAAAPESVVVEYAGPMRATVCAKGHFTGDDKSRLGYVARVTAWAGRSDVHLKYSLTNSNPEHYTWRRIRESSLALKLAAKVDVTLLGGKDPIVSDAPASICQGLRTDTDGHTIAATDDKRLWTAAPNDRPGGWIAAKSGDRAVFACDWYFSDDPPRKLATTANSLVLFGVVPRFDGPESPARPGVRLGHPMGDKCRWICDCSHLSSQYRIDFAAPPAGADLAAKATAARSRLLAIAPPAWYSDTEGLFAGKFGTLDDEVACYKTWDWKYDANRVPKAPFKDNGRRYVEGEDNHYETEEDVVETLLLLFLRCPTREYFTTLEAWANYNVDLQAWRTDGWRWKDGGVWWTEGGPLGNHPQRGKDPVTGNGGGVPAPYAKSFTEPFNHGAAQDLFFMANAKACYCHNWGEGLTGWFCLTGDRDVLETCIDLVEQNIDTQARAFGKSPGKTNEVSRDYTRSVCLTNATRLLVPDDKYVVEASEFYTEVWLKRPSKEPRGMLAPAVDKLDMLHFKYEDYVGKQGMDELEKRGVIVDDMNGALTDFKTGARWLPVIYPHIWMYPPLSRGMECYYRLTGDEDVRDWVIAYGQAVAHLFYQEQHYGIHDKFLLDFPVKGVCKDFASWTLEKDNKNAAGIVMSGYLTCFHPDVAARAYSLAGESLGKQRAYDIWNGGSHRGYQAKDMHALGGVGWWVNYYGVHSESVLFTHRTFYEWSHPRKDEKPPAKIADLTVTVEGDKATVAFTAPADEGGGKVVRYQVKCSDKPIVSYQDFLKAWEKDKDKKVCNWWMAANLSGEPAPAAPGAKEKFVVSGLPEDVKYFAVRSFDDSSNWSEVSNAAQAP